MRKEKYAHVLEEQQENENSLDEVISLLDETKKEFEGLVEQKEETKELDKLSMTREIKFKDLQEQIEKDEKAVTQEIILDKPVSKNVESSLPQEEPEIQKLPKETKKRKNKSRQKKNEEIKSTEKKDDDDVTITKIDLKKINELEDVNLDKDLEKTLSDDLYLTTAFKPVKKRVRKVIKKIFVFIFVIAIFAAVIYFFLWPLYKKYTIKPKEIFENNIDYISNDITNLIDKDFLSFDYTNANAKIILNTNDKTYKELSKYDLNIITKKDTKQKESVFGFKIDNEDKSIGFNSYNIDNKLYYEVLNSDNIISIKKEEDVKSLLDNKYLSLISNTNKDELKYIIEKNKNVLKELIPEENLSKNNDELTISDKKIKTTKISLELDASLASKLTSEYYSKILSDNKYAEIISQLNDMSINEYKSSVRNITYDSNFKAKINFYVKNGDEFVGLDIEINGFSYLHYLKSNDYSNFYINLGINKKEANAFEFIKTKEDNKDKILIKHNTKDTLVLYINELNNDILNINYETLSLHENIKGNITLKKESQDKFNVSITINNDLYYYNLSIKLEANDNSIIFNENQEKNIIEGTEESINTERELFMSSIKELNLYTNINSLISLLKEKNNVDISKFREGLLITIDETQSNDDESIQDDKLNENDQSETEEESETNETSANKDKSLKKASTSAKKSK